MLRSRFRLLAAVLVAATLAMGSPPSQADPLVLPDPLAPIDSDNILSCTQLTPHAISVDNARVRLDLRILLDGVGKRKARRAVRSMRKAYAPLNIAVAPSYERVRFRGVDADGLNRQAKKHYGGKRPRGIDVVYTLTSKDITAAGPLGDDVAGLADCIGGVRYARHAFAVGEKHKSGGGLLPFPVREGTGKIMAHEIGHLLGGHHHYFSPEGLLAADPSFGSLMGPSLSIISLRFSTLNSLMVKGHAQRYAR